MRTILVCGGRDYGSAVLKERTRLFQVLDEIHAEKPVDLIVHGAATGADRLARRWCEVRGVKEKPYPADWEDLDHPNAIIKEHANGREYNAAAGWIRNQLMLDSHPEIELVVAFPGGRGTNDMTTRAGKAGITIQHEAKVTQ